MIKVLFVCLGNICRSPMAEAVMAHKVKEQGLNEQIVVHSAGTADYHVGHGPDVRTMDVLKKNNVSLTHLGRQIESKDLSDYDYVVAMDQSNLDNIKKLDAAGTTAKLALLRDWDTVRDSVEVPDPYYGGTDGFHDVYAMVERSTSQMLEWIKDEHGL